MESEENIIRRNQNDGSEEKWMTDETSNPDEPFFVHFRTSECTYERPEGPNVKIIPEEEMRTGLWVETRIGNDVCFCNARTKEVYWNRPEGLYVKIITEEQAQNLKEEIQIWKREANLERKLLNELQGPVGQSAMEFVEATKLRQVIKNQLKRTGKGFTNAVELIKSTLEMPDQRVRTSSPVPSSSREEATLESFKQDYDIKEEYKEVIEKIIEVEVVEALKEAIDEAIEERYTCKVCLDVQIEVVFLPCGHLASCSSCASDLRNCPLCHQVIHGTAKIHLPEY